MSHTPGPWDWEPEGDGENCASEPYVYAQNVDHRDGKQPLIALCYVPTSLQNRYYGVDVDSEEVANARLIAAAPELLEALEASRKAINTLDEDALGMETREDGHGGINYWPFKVELLHQIDTAIAKARGQE